MIRSGHARYFVHATMASARSPWRRGLVRLAPLRWRHDMEARLGGDNQLPDLSPILLRPLLGVFAVGDLAVKLHMLDDLRSRFRREARRAALIPRIIPAPIRVWHRCLRYAREWPVQRDACGRPHRPLRDGLFGMSPALPNAKCILAIAQVRSNVGFQSRFRSAARLEIHLVPRVQQFGLTHQRGPVVAQVSDKLDSLCFGNASFIDQTAHHKAAIRARRFAHVFNHHVGCPFQLAQRQPTRDGSAPPGAKAARL